MDDPKGLNGMRRVLQEWSDIPLRFILAYTFMHHGYGKVFGGMGKFISGLEAMGVPFPTISGWLAGLAEFGGGFLMAIGLFTRVAALGHIAVMLVAILVAHKSQKLSELEFQMALLCIALALLIRGAGPLSFDAIIRKGRKTADPKHDRQF